jgi:hypothetical protein
MDDFDEEIFDDDDTILGDDEVFDCMLLDELEKESEKKKGPGCLTFIFLAFSTISSLGAIMVLIFI